MIPTIYEIAIKDVLKVNINDTLEEAIKIMASSHHRTIVIENEKEYKILTTEHLIDFKLSHIEVSSILKDLNLPTAKVLDKDLNILNVLNQINTTNDFMVLTDKNNSLVGIISYTDIINNIDPQVLMKKQSIGTLILNYKIATCTEETSTLLAVKRMKKSGNDAVIVNDEFDKPIGIFTTKDFINVIYDNTCLEKPIKNYMSKPIITLKHDTTISEALDFIKEKKFKRIVIVDDNHNLEGVITQKELLRVVYNKWVDFIKAEGDRISKTNQELLESKNQLEEIASIDFLTQIYNRQKLESFLDYEIKKLSRYDNENFSVLLVDLDHFKKVNDTHGHLMGDIVLQEVAKVLTLCSRSSDVVARWGGEEFVMLLPHTNLDDALFVAQKFRATIEKHIFDNGLQVTCSIGIAQYHRSDSKESLFKRADKALYKAKDLGRNRVEIEYLKNLE